MDIFAFIEKLQKKPESSRKKILATALFLIMSVIVAIWLSGLSLRFSNKEEEAKKIGGPMGFIKEDISAFYGYIKENINRIK